MANLKRQGRIEWRVAAVLLSALLLVVSGPDSPAAPAGLDRVQHIVVLYLENRSFDNLYGLFPGAEGLQNLDRIAPQVDEHGEPYKTLPRALDSTLRTPDLKEDDPSPVDPRIPANLPNHPFRIDSFVPLDARSGDLVHRFLTERRQIHGGKMDRFIVEGNTGSLPLGYYDGSSLAMWNLAQELTLADHFFHAAFGGSFLNHFWLICACSPEIRPQDWAILDRKMLDNPSDGKNPQNCLRSSLARRRQGSHGTHIWSALRGGPPTRPADDAGSKRKFHRSPQGRLPARRQGSRRPTRSRWGYLHSE